MLFSKGIGQKLFSKGGDVNKLFSKAYSVGKDTISTINKNSNLINTIGNSAAMATGQPEIALATNALTKYANYLK